MLRTDYLVCVASGAEPNCTRVSDTSFIERLTLIIHAGIRTHRHFFENALSDKVGNHIKDNGQILKDDVH